MLLRADIITAVAGTPVHTLQEFTRVLHQSPHGDIALTVTRPRRPTEKWQSSIMCARLKYEAMDAMLRKESAQWCQEQHENHGVKHLLLHHMETDAFIELRQLEQKKLRGFACTKLQGVARGSIHRRTAKQAVRLPQAVDDSFLSTYLVRCSLSAIHSVLCRPLFYSIILRQMLLVRTFASHFSVQMSCEHCIPRSWSTRPKRMERCFQWMFAAVRRSSP